MLYEYALLPDTLTSRCYSGADVERLCFSQLSKVILHRGVVRNLRNGEWRQFLEKNKSNLSPLGSKLLEALAKSARLGFSPKCLGSTPSMDREWCKAALIHKERLKGIVASKEIKEHSAFTRENLVGAVDRLDDADWWDPTDISVSTKRNVDQYVKHVFSILQHSNEVIFVDPNLDPSKQNYKNFFKFIHAIRRSAEDVQPVIELHIELWPEPQKGVSNETRKHEIRRSFKSLEEDLHVGTRIKVIVWDKIHDRYLLSNLIGINFPAGFDEELSPKATTTLTIISPKDRDELRTSIDPSVSNLTKIDEFVLEGKPT